eukprot:306160_1
MEYKIYFIRGSQYCETNDYYSTIRDQIDVFETEFSGNNGIVFSKREYHKQSLTETIPRAPEILSINNTSTEGNHRPTCGLDYLKTEAALNDAVKVLFPGPLFNRFPEWINTNRLR